MKQTRNTPEWDKYLCKFHIDKKQTRVENLHIFSSLQISLI